MKHTDYGVDALTSPGSILDAIRGGDMWEEQYERIKKQSEQSFNEKLKPIQWDGSELDRLSWEQTLRQQGRKEVVDWVEKHRQGIVAYGVYIPNDEWQSFKEERGL